MARKTYDRSSHKTEAFLSQKLEIESGWQEILLSRIVLDLKLHPTRTGSALDAVHRFGLRQMIEALIKAPDQTADVRTLLVAVPSVIYRHRPTPEEKLGMVRHLLHLHKKTRQDAAALSDRQLQRL